MALMYEVTGYDHITRNLAVSHDIPMRWIDAVKSIAKVPESDEGGAYPLSHEQVSAIGMVIGMPIDRRGLDFFLEPFEAPQQAAG